MKMWKNELFQFILKIILGSIFNICYGTPILSCSTDTSKYHKITKIAKATKIVVMTKIPVITKIPKNAKIRY